MVGSISLDMEPVERPLNILVWYWGREASKYSADLLYALHDLPNLKIVLSCSAGSDLHVAAKQIEGLPILAIPTFSGSKKSWHGKLSALVGAAGFPVTMLRFYRLLRKHKIDVAIGIQSAVWDIATMPFLARGRVRYIQIIHEILGHYALEAVTLRARVTPHQLAIADGVIVLSDQIMRQVIDVWHCPPGRCWKMPHGSYSYGSKPATAAAHPRGARPMRLLLFGRIEPYKGLERLFAALQMLRERGLPFKLTIAGVGSLADHQQHLVSPDVEVHNRWLGDDEVAKFLEANELMVLPYTASSQSGVAASAYGAGRTVVATPIGGLREQVLPDTGLLARDMSAKAFADALADMINNPELFDRCTAGALRYAQTDLNWRNCIGVVQTAIQQVAAMPRRHSRYPRQAIVRNLKMISGKVRK